MTKYKVFYKPPATQNAAAATGRGPNDWTLLDKSYEAASSVSAAKAAALDHGKGGAYAALPERSWDPITIEIVTNPRVKVVR